MTIAQKRLVAYAFLTLATILWGSSVVVIKFALPFADPLNLLWYRMVIAAISTIPILMLHYKTWKKFLRHKQLQFGVVTLIDISAISLIYIGLNLTTALNTNLIQATFPLIVTYIGVLWLKEREEAHEMLGLGLALICTVTLIVLPILQTGWNTTESSSFWGNLIALAGYTLAALQVTTYKKWLLKSPVMLYNSVFNLVITILLGTSLLISSLQANVSLLDAIIQDVSNWQVVASTLFGGLGASLIASFCFLRAMQLIETSEAVLFDYLRPLVYVPLGFVLLGETISLSQACLLLLIIAGVYIAERRWKRQSWLYRWLKKTGVVKTKRRTVVSPKP